MNRMSRWGVGPTILMTALSYIAVASTVTYHWPNICLIHTVPNPVFLAPALLLLAIGVPWLLVALIALTRNYNRDQLATGGIYGIVRHPIYAAWILFLIPGLVLLSPSWPLLLTPLVAYSAFRAKIGREESYLEARFGDRYRRYRSEVGALFPFVRAGGRRAP